MASVTAISCKEQEEEKGQILGLLMGAEPNTVLRFPDQETG